MNQTNFSKSGMERIEHIVEYTHFTSIIQCWQCCFNSVWYDPFSWITRICSRRLSL